MTQGWDWDADPAAAAAAAAPPLRPSSPARRVVGVLLESALIVVTVGIGWLVWSLIVWRLGLTPAKQILGMRVVEEVDGRPAVWWTMFLREYISKPLSLIPAAATLGVLLAMPAWSDRHQALWDRIAGTVVVDTR